MNGKDPKGEAAAAGKAAENDDVANKPAAETTTPAENRTGKADLNWPIWALFVAAVLGIAAGVTAPSIPAKGEPPAWFVPFFTTSAGVIATLFITLTLGGRQIPVKPWIAWVTVSCIALGEVAAVAGLSTELPHAVYPWLIGVTVGAGIAALLNSVIVGGRAIADDEAKRQAAWGGEIDGRWITGAKPAPKIDD